MIQIYGSPRSSAGRCYLLLEELGLKYENVPLDMHKREHKGEAFLKLNPNGKVPCLVDGNFVIWESIAINNYLAEKHKPELLGVTPEEKALVLQWSLWGLLELQSPLVDILVQTLFTPEDKRDHTLISKSREKVPPCLAILDKALVNKKYLVGEKLSLADFNVASVVNIVVGLQMSLEPYRQISAWFGHLKERPSFQKFTAMRAH